MIGRFLGISLLAGLTLSAASIDVSTPTNWLVDFGAGPSASYSVGGGFISISSDAHSTGAHSPYLDFSSWNGYWTATRSFFLPSDISNIYLNVKGLEADDRAALLLNGHLVTVDALQRVGPGWLAFTSTGHTNVTYTDFAPFTIFDQSWFNAGGENTLLAIVNNTLSPSISGPLVTINADNGTEFFLDARVGYETPEPAAFFLLGTGVAALALIRRRAQ